MIVAWIGMAIARRVLGAPGHYYRASCWRIGWYPNHEIDIEIGSISIILDQDHIWIGCGDRSVYEFFPGRRESGR
jgi:hypothetical protein